MPMYGSLAAGAQVLTTWGDQQNPDSSAKTMWAPIRAAFFTRGQSCRFQRSMAGSFRSTARFSGFVDFSSVGASSARCDPDGSSPQPRAAIHISATADGSNVPTPEPPDGTLVGSGLLRFISSVAPRTAPDGLAALRLDAISVKGLCCYGDDHVLLPAMSSRCAVGLRAAHDERAGIVDRDLAVAVYVPRVAWRYGLSPRGEDETDIRDIDVAIPIDIARQGGCGLSDSKKWPVARLVETLEQFCRFGAAGSIETGEEVRRPQHCGALHLAKASKETSASQGSQHRFAPGRRRRAYCQRLDEFHHFATGGGSNRPNPPPKPRFGRLALKKYAQEVNAISFTSTSSRR